MIGSVINSYDKTTNVRISAEFQIGTTDVDSTTITCRYKDPSGALTVLIYGVDMALIREATGKYYADISVSLPGYWYYRFESSGIYVSAAESQFYVKQSQF